MTSDVVSIRRALISVSDKTGLVEFSKFLASRNIEIVSTGGTWKVLDSHGIATKEVSEITNFPEIMAGRVKTLHPKVFGGILGRRDLDEDSRAMQELALPEFDLVVVNLYPFKRTIANPNSTLSDAIENIDIGGPSLIRAAAKNHRFVAVATSPEQYAAIQDELDRYGGTSLRLRRKLALQCFRHTSHYDSVIAEYLGNSQFDCDLGAECESNPPPDFPQRLTLKAVHDADLRYGENPHQRAAVYRWFEPMGASLVTAMKLHGKELSYNNLLDLDSALRIASSFSDPSAVVVKHNNPCGAAVGDSLSDACEKALAGDPLSAFGGVMSFNRAVDVATAEILSTPGLFIEAIVAPSFDPEAITMLTTRPKWKANVRLIAVGDQIRSTHPFEYRMILGGLLVQDSDSLSPDPSDWKVVTKLQPNPDRQSDIAFAWEMVRHVKSNGIVLAQNRSLIGVGAGQMSRVDSVEIAIRKAGERAKGSVLASDAFFPFPDSIEKAAAAGIQVILQPGGARNDPDVISACDAEGIAMIFTQRRHFKH